MDRKFQGIWIPAEIWLNTDLAVLEKCLLAEIQSLGANPKGCFASNSYFANFMGVSERQVQRTIAKLKKMKLIKQKRFDGKKRFLKRIINEEVTKKGDKGQQHRQKCHSSIDKNVTPLYKDNNTSNNIGIYIPKNQKNEEKKIKTEKIEKINPEIIKIVDFFYGHIKKNHSRILKSIKLSETEIKNKWIDTLEKCIRIDGRTTDEIAKAVEFILTNPFWQKNCYSLSKLRRRNKEGVMYIDEFLHQQETKTKKMNPIDFW